MTPEDRQTILRVAEWAMQHKRKAMSMLRELANTEENYLIIVRELDRVNAQIFQARAQHAAATLTLVDWIKTLDHFEWHCAYCRERPFQIMSHYLPLQLAGTTSTNCVPACYSCRANRKKESPVIQAYLNSIAHGSIDAV